MTKIKKISLFTIIICIMMCFCACTDKNNSADNESSPTTEITEKWGLNAESLTLSIGNTYQLSVVGDYVGTIVWVSEDHNVVTVENGLLVAKSIGSCAVWAFSDNHSAKCEVTSNIIYEGIPQFLIDNVRMEAGEYTLNLLQGDSFQFIPYIYVNGKKQTVETTLSCASTTLSINGTTVTATQTTENTELVLSCVYEEETYTIRCVVTVDEE